MLISMNWINDFVDLSGLDLEKLIHQFTLSTAEVESKMLLFRASFPSKTTRIPKNCTS